MALYRSNKSQGSNWFRTGSGAKSRCRTSVIAEAGRRGLCQLASGIIRMR